jgi:hypothetical protein
MFGTQYAGFIENGSLGLGKFVNQNKFRND